MTRYIGPRLRITRRLGKIPGLTSKASTRLSLPGQHGSGFIKKQSQFGVRLKEKQKLRFHYCLSERQMVNYLKKAKSKKGSSGLELLVSLEMRLDNIIFRLGVSPTVMAARQLVVHGKVSVNGKVINVPSFSCTPRHLISIDKSVQIARKNVNLSVPSHLSFNNEKFQGKIVNFASRSCIPFFINELLVIEYYSRKV